ncbi:MAG: HAD family hydrolase [Candidatus Caldatribacteriota bacterium]|nr:HAD family hydrolase [Candidatus Caldatribacteriota bacterium]
MKILALDFDGVIVDSILDSLFVSHNAYLRFYGQKRKKYFGGELFTFENWEKIKRNYQKEIKYYRTFRPYIRGATDYGLIQKLLEEKKVIGSQEEFDNYKKKTDFDFRNYEEEFYKERERLQNKDYRAWFNLEPPYPEIIKGVKKLLENGVKIVIATSNRRRAIMKSFTSEYFGFFIPPKDILDKRFGEDKSEQMKYIVESYKVSFKDIYFVDDQISHLIQTKLLGVKVFLAGWSYATKTQKEDARKQNIPLMEKEKDFYPMIKNVSD